MERKRAKKFRMKILESKKERDRERGGENSSQRERVRELVFVIEVLFSEKLASS